VHVVISVFVPAVETAGYHSLMPSASLGPHLPVLVFVQAVETAGYRSLMPIGIIGTTPAC
jgi:hypothetical protein